MALKNENELTRFQLGVCGYPAEEELYIKSGYPQVSMFSNLKKAQIKEEGKVILYHDVLTS